MNLYDRIIDQFINKVKLLLTLKYSLALLTAWFFLWGTVIIALRMTLGTARGDLIWGLIGIIPAVVVAFLISTKKLPSPIEVRALLDRENRCGGLLMASQEARLGNWRKNLPDPSAPSLRWQGGRFWRYFAAGILFLGTCFLLPQRYVVAKETHKLEIGGGIERLSEQIDVLKEEELIEEIQAEALEKQLTQIEADASGEDPVKTLESIDYLDDVIQKSAQTAAEEGLRETDELTQAETLAGGMLEEVGTMEPKVMARAMAELTGMVQQEAKKRKQLKKRLGEQTQNACRKGSLNKEQMQEILNALRRRKQEIKQMMKKLQEAGMLDKKQLSQCEKLGQCNSQGLSEFLNENASQKTVSEMVRTWRRGSQQEGNTNRGPGTGGMDYWDSAASEEGTDFKEQILPPSQIPDWKNSQVFRLDRSEPNKPGKPALVESGALSNSQAKEGAAFHRTVLPQHKGIISRYFERESDK